MYTVEALKKEYKDFDTAKKHFTLKARGWQALCDKLNGKVIKPPSVQELKAENAVLQAQIQELKAENASLRSQLSRPSAKSDLDLMLTDLVYKRGVGSDEIFESDEVMQFEPEGTGRDDWAYFESVLRRRYHLLSKRYHPDNGGSAEQQNNLKHAYTVAETFVNQNGGLGK